jgi:hypothetical protein
VDNNSIGGTPEVARWFPERVVFLRQENAGPPAACTGEFGRHRARFWPFSNAKNFVRRIDPPYNGARRIRGALRSVREQAHSPVEIRVITGGVSGAGAAESRGVPCVL